MRAVLILKSGQTVDRTVAFPPPLRLKDRPGYTAPREFKLRGGSWKPVSEAQLAVYEEVEPKKYLKAHKKSEPSTPSTPYLGLDLPVTRDEFSAWRGEN